MKSVLCRESVLSSLREHLGTYLLGSLSSAFLTASQYLAVSSAVSSYLPVEPGTSALITSYGRVLGIILVLLLNSLVFQGILSVLVVILAVSSVANAGWKWAFTLSNVAISGFVGYWLGAKFLAILEWISALQNNRVNSSDTYAGLFWFGLAATICYVAMILVLRKSYDKLAQKYLLV